MNERASKILLGLIISGVVLFLLFYWAFQPTYENVEIKQKVGGTLLCSSVNSKWNSIIYKYKTPYNDTIYIGQADYCGRRWNKDEQLIQYGNWTILKTGNWYGSDKIIIGKFKDNSFKEYKFEPDSIENEKLWKAANIHSLLNYCCAEVFIDNIENGQIKAHYKYRTDEMNTNKYEKRNIYYNIDSITGKPSMFKVE